jgi:starch-binding outer membrane protein, SusD/RagB family
MKNTLSKNISNVIKQKQLLKSQFLLGMFLFIMLLTSCDVFKKEPLDSVPEEDIWNNEGLATLYLNNLYALTMPGFPGTSGNINVSNISDEAAPGGYKYANEDTKHLPGGASYMYGLLDNTSVGDFNSDTYSKIRKINILLENIRTGSISKNATQLIVGQALFLRAWVYWNLVKLYGGVPMVMNVQDPFSAGNVAEDVKVKRNTTRECIILIAADLDSAYNYLPAKWDDVNYGRITRGAAIALKGRMLLFWASPQFNPQNKTERWQWAYDVNKAALDNLTKDGYGLHSSFKELFVDCKEKTKEAILVRVYDAGVSGTFYHGYDKSVRPVAEGKSGGGGTNNATWNLVQAFPMADGYPISAASTTNPYYQDRYWMNRDPRFAFTIAYNSCIWPLSGNATYKIWTYYNSKTVDGKVDTVRTEGSSNYSLTSFYCRKYVNPTIKKEVCDQISTDWMEIRFAEVLLNFAECANELVGKATEARDALNRIRNERTDVKAGMAYIDANINKQDIMREIIMNERQIELAFENKRHWDLRRRNMFENDLGPNVKKLNNTRRCGWRVALNESPSRTPDYMLNIRDGLDFNLAIVYNTYLKSGRRDTLDTQSPINYLQPKYNFYAIPQTNLDKNPNLEQTNYWGGTFDPLAE